MKAMCCKCVFVDWYADQKAAVVVNFLLSDKDPGNKNFLTRHMTVTARELRAIDCFKELNN